MSLNTEPNTRVIVLASSSPRRRELVAQLGLDVTVAPADIDECTRAGERPSDYVLRLARSKAAKIAASHENCLVIGADTTIADGDVILGKPDNSEHAVSMLSALAGRKHRVLTGVALAHGDTVESQVVTTHVKLLSLTTQEIRDYVATGEPEGKAGAYAIQGLGAVLIESIEGSYSNVVDLPLAETAMLLKRFNVNVLADFAGRQG